MMEAVGFVFKNVSKEVRVASTQCDFTNVSIPVNPIIYKVNPRKV